MATPLTSKTSPCGSASVLPRISQGTEEELTNVSTCSVSSNLSLTEASSHRDNDDCYDDVSFMFGVIQASSLKRFEWSRSPPGTLLTKTVSGTAVNDENATGTGTGSECQSASMQVQVALHVVDDEAGNLQSGHYLSPAATGLAEYLIQQASISVLPSVSPTTAVSPVAPPRNCLELGAGCALLSLTALQLWHDSLQCVVVTDHDPGALERAKDNRETTLEDLLESTETEEEQLDCINGLASIPILFETLEWGSEDTAQCIARAAAEHTSPLSLQNHDQEHEKKGNPNHDTERNFFDLLLGSDLIYCHDVVEPLFRTVSFFMSPGGSFLLSQSITSSNDEIDDAIDKICQKLNLQRSVLKNSLEKNQDNRSSTSVAARIEQFTWKTSR